MYVIAGDIGIYMIFLFDSEFFHGMIHFFEYTNQAGLNKSKSSR